MAGEKEATIEELNADAGRRYYVRFRYNGQSGVPVFDSEMMTGKNQQDIFSQITQKHADKNIFVEKIIRADNEAARQKPKRKYTPYILAGLGILVLMSRFLKSF